MLRVKAKTRLILLLFVLHKKHLLNLTCDYKQVLWLRLDLYNNISVYIFLSRSNINKCCIFPSRYNAINSQMYVYRMYIVNIIVKNKLFLS